MKTVIVGAGISGLATAYALLVKHPDIELEIFEASARAGGKVWSDHTEEGFLCESGVNAFLDNRPGTLALSQELELAPVTSHDAARHRFVYSDQQLHELPTTPPAFLRSNLLSVTGRLRVALETLQPRGSKADESLADFARRRLGQEAFEKLIDPMASGVFAGDAEALSLKSCFPRIHEVESEFRSLILGLIRLQLRARHAGKALPGAGPGGKLTSFDGGMSTLTDAIAHKLGDRLHLSTPIAGIEKNNDHYHLHLTNGHSVETERLILAAPAHAQAKLLQTMAPTLSEELAAIPYPSLSVCCLGFKRDKIQHALKGFGFLVPSRENRNILGTLWDSSIFPHRTPPGYVLLRSMIGGAHAPQLALLPDDQLVDVVRQELAAIMGIEALPDFVRVYRHQQAIPQYVVGHQQRLTNIEAMLKSHANLILTGNAYRGVALNDCIANAYQLADRLD
jgi:oxygen-dependent protoporphyrinogen oxidase